MFARTELVMQDGSIGESVSAAGAACCQPLDRAHLSRWPLDCARGDRNAIALSELFLEEFPDLPCGGYNSPEGEW